MTNDKLPYGMHVKALSWVHVAHGRETQIEDDVVYPMKNYNVTPTTHLNVRYDSKNDTWKNVTMSQLMW